MRKVSKKGVPLIKKATLSTLNTDLHKSSSYFTAIWKFVIFCALIISALLLFPATQHRACASSGAYKVSTVSGQELEKPKPLFTRAENTIKAKYIPRAKSSSVTVNFNVTKGGKLIDVKGIDFEKAARPEVDIKDFKSALFLIEIKEISPAGSDATVNISSDFFTSGTEYHVFNEKLPQPWFNSECHNVAMNGRVRELLITVKDGGPYDSDGQADGSVTFVGGPKDSFWGYALGTLVIRFFGVFLVLSVLMVGMILSGVFFSRIESRKEERQSAAVESEPVDEEATSDSQLVEAEIESDQYREEEWPDVDYETAAAIAIALHLHFESSDSPRLPDSQAVSRRAYSRAGQAPASEQSSWSNHGREQIMRDRAMVYNRGNS